MRKKVLPLLIAIIVFFVPFGSAFAYSGGLLSGKTVNIAGSQTVPYGTTTLITDNDESTSITLDASAGPNDWIYYEFPEVMDLSSYKLKAISGSALYIRAYSIAGASVGGITNLKIDGTQTALSNFKAVKKIAIQNTSSTTNTIYEFDVFGTPNDGGGLLRGVAPTHVSNLNATDGANTSYNSINATEHYWVLPEEKKIDSYILSVSGQYGTYINFYDSSGKILHVNTAHFKSTNTVEKIQLTTPYANVKKIGLFTNSTDGRIYEVDVFTSNIPVVKTDVANLELSNITKNSVNVTWDNPSNYSGVNYNGANIYLNGVLKTTTSPTSTSFSLTGLSPNTSYSVKVVASYSDGTETTGIIQTFTTNRLSNITNLLDTIDYRTANFTWVNPEDTEFQGVKIYRNDVLVTTLDKTTNTYSENITPSTTYTYKFVAIYSDGLESSGVIRTINTDPLPPVKKVHDVDVTTTYNRVNISWSLPEQDGLKHVNIYRKKIEEEPGFFESIFSLSGTKVYAAESDKIFETNGTYFNDFTVQPESEYEYTLTTQTDDGRESEGVKVIAETKKEPEPVLVDDGYTVEPTNGDYTFKWSEPTTGTVKVLINGSHYKTVEASEKQIVIPNGDMKYTILGDPDISLVPISPYGKEGNKVTNPGGLINSLKLPFDVTDLLQTIMGIIGLFAPFILLTLVIYYFKPIKNLIVRAAHQIRKGDVRNE
jgi:hypothetical protein